MVGASILFIQIMRVRIGQESKCRLHFVEAKQLLASGIPAQIGVALQNLHEPISKLLLELFGSHSAVAAYELVTRCITQSRALLVASLEPVFAHVSGISDPTAANLEKRTHLYNKITTSINPIVALTFGIALSLTPVAEIVFLGGEVTFFSFASIVLGIAWAYNTTTSCDFFYLMAGGYTWVATGSITIILVINLTLGYWLGSRFGAQGVALAGALGLVVASVAINNWFNRFRMVSSRTSLGAFRNMYLFSALISLTPLIMYNIWSVPFLYRVLVSVFSVSAILLVHERAGTRRVVVSLWRSGMTKTIL